MIYHNKSKDIVKEGVTWYSVYPSFRLLEVPGGSRVWWDQFPDDMIVKSGEAYTMKRLVHEKLFTILCLQYEIEEV